ncbi:MAG: radical SAM protein, partial [Scytonema sp. CRU_2_7]|nr:radical SAM protein [Scytonema sp. CRU_2_7]
QAALKTVVCWTGYYLEHLKVANIPGTFELLEHVDLLIDGPYVEAQAENLVLRGSKNQKLHFLSGKMTAGDLVNIPRQEWTVSSEQIVYTGFPIQG